MKILITENQLEKIALRCITSMVEHDMDPNKKYNEDKYKIVKYEAYWTYKNSKKPFARYVQYKNGDRVFMFCDNHIDYFLNSELKLDDTAIRAVIGTWVQFYLKLPRPTHIMITLPFDVSKLKGI